MFGEELSSRTSRIFHIKLRRVYQEGEAPEMTDPKGIGRDDCGEHGHGWELGGYETVPLRGHVSVELLCKILVLDFGDVARFLWEGAVPRGGGSGG